MSTRGMISGCLAFLALLPSALAGGPAVRGKVVDQGGAPVCGALVQVMEGRALKASQAITEADGAFHVSVKLSGAYRLQVTAPTFQTFMEPIRVTSDEAAHEIHLTPRLTRRDSVVVTADIHDVDLTSPDPAEKVFVRQDLLDANPGRPGAPVSVPGYPIETASGGIKAPQYFAPGVAGDHGEPIAQYVAVGGYLVPNNLSANAHGNGYADPNILIPQTLESVEVDGGAYNVREGNHSVNLAAAYGLRSRLDRFATLTGDNKDVDLVAGLSPDPASWIAFEGSYGNGFLARLEHRQQYKFNGERVFTPGSHRITALGIGYWGSSYVPGLVPIWARGTEDTIDPRQKDQTHTALAAVNDAWRLGGNRGLNVSGFFRTYNLSLFSNFGQGLIRQSEFRTVAGASSFYSERFSAAASLLAGFDFEREAPRRDNLDHYDFYTPGDRSYGPFSKVDSSNVTIIPLSPYAALAGAPSGWFRYSIGWRRDQIDFNNQDLLTPANSFHKWVGVNSPKATLAFVPPQGRFAPELAFSYGRSFFTEDPRIGTGTAAGTPVATSRSYQLVASRTLRQTDLKLTLGHTNSSQELAKIDPDTGLQEDEGPSRLLFLSAAVRQSFRYGSVLATFSKADARDIHSGWPAPEAPRTIIDVLGSINRLPLRVQARGEFEYVGRKPLGTGCLPDVGAQCAGVAVREFRAAAVRSFLDDRMDVGLNFLIAGGYSGQTTENIFPSPVEEVTGVRIPSYASLNLTYRFGLHAGQ